MEKKGHKSRPSNRNETRKRSRKYLKTSGLKRFFDVEAGLFSIFIILAVQGSIQFFLPAD